MRRGARRTSTSSCGASTPIGAFAGLLADRIEVDLPEGKLSVVSLETLKRMKRLASRNLDLADLERLEDDRG